MTFVEKVSTARSLMTGESKGQGLVEFALLLSLFGIVLLGMIDPAFALFDIAVAKTMSGRGARAAAIYMPDGTRTCYGDVQNALGTPGLIMADWTETVTYNCNSNPLDTHAPGEDVMVEVEVTYRPMFWNKNNWVFNVQTWEQAR